MSADTTFFSIVSFITFILVATPFPWHLEAWNTGTCLYMAWTSLGCLNLFINSVIWRGNMVNWAPVWCDISTKLMVGTSIALPAASLCINRRLYHIAIIRTVTATKSDKRRAVITDLSIGLGLPVLFMILQYVVQGHRFDIFEDYGCMTFTYNTPVAYLIVQTPVLVLGLISTVYAVLSIMAFKRRTIELQVLLSSSSGPSPNRYLRLMCLAGIEILLSMPIALIGIAISAQGDVEPWISWEDTHFDFSRVDQYPAALWRADVGSRFALEQARWVVVVCGLFFFAFFGFAEEARRHYWVMYNTVTWRLGVNVGEDEASTGSKKTEFNFKINLALGTLKASGSTTKVYVKKETVSQRDSLASISTSTHSFQFQDVGGLLSDATVNLVKGETAKSGSKVSANPSSVGCNRGRDSSRTASFQFEDVGGLLPDPTTSSSETTTAVSSPATENELELPANESAPLPSADTTESMYSTSTEPDPGPALPTRGADIHVPAHPAKRPSPPRGWRPPVTVAPVLCRPFDQDRDLERGLDGGESFLDLSM